MTAATLILDELMTHPRYPELVGVLRRLAPPAAVDQADAATADALRTVTAMAQHLGGDQVHGQRAADVPGWLRLGVLDALTSWLTGLADTCRHSPTADRPVPVMAAAWRPGLIACRACAHLFHVGGAEADATCDGCGHRCAGPEHGDPIYPSLIQLGPLVFQYGACTDCQPTPRRTT